MPKSLEDVVFTYLKNTVYPASASTDLTTMLTRRIKELTNSEATARLKAIIDASGTHN